MSIIAACLSKGVAFLMTEKMLGSVVIEVLRILASKTSNTLDDELVAAIEKTLK